LRRIFRITSKELQNLFHTEFSNILLGTAFDSLVGELALPFLECEDALFDGRGDGDFVDYHVGFLGETVDAVDGLFFDELYDKLVLYGLEGMETAKGWELTGFQKGSRMTTRVAAVRLRPRDPHLRLQSRIRQDLSLRRRSKLASRRSFFILPS